MKYKSNTRLDFMDSEVRNQNLVTTHHGINILDHVVSTSEIYFKVQFLVNATFMYFDLPFLGATNSK